MLSPLRAGDPSALLLRPELLRPRAAAASHRRGGLERLGAAGAEHGGHGDGERGRRGGEEAVRAGEHGVQQHLASVRLPRRLLLGLVRQQVRQVRCCPLCADGAVECRECRGIVLLRSERACGHCAEKPQCRKPQCRMAQCRNATSERETDSRGIVHLRCGGLAYVVESSERRRRRQRRCG